MRFRVQIPAEERDLIDLKSIRPCDRYSNLNTSKPSELLRVHSVHSKRLLRITFISWFESDSDRKASEMPS